MAGHATSLDESAVSELQEQFRGTLLREDGEGYDEARSIWNGMIDRHPALIAQCAGVADVIAAVTFAREHDLLVAVKGGGHNVAGNAVCDDGLVIDLSEMNSVRVDPDAKTVRVSNPASRLATSTTKRRRSGSPLRGGSSRRPGWPGSR